MKVTFDSQDIMKALSIYMFLKGYETDGYYDFRWRRELSASVDVNPLSRQLSYDELVRYANR